VLNSSSVGKSSTLAGYLTFERDAVLYYSATAAKINAMLTRIVVLTCRGNWSFMGAQ